MAVLLARISMERVDVACQRHPHVHMPDGSRQATNQSWHRLECSEQCCTWASTQSWLTDLDVHAQCEPMDVHMHERVSREIAHQEANKFVRAYAECQSVQQCQSVRVSVSATVSECLSVSLCS